MRTTLALDDELLEKAERYTGLKEKSALVREALKALIERESTRRLASLGGTEPLLQPVSRRSAQDGVRMVLVDTSVWVEHLQRGNSELAGLLQRGQVLLHPFVVGELALGSLQQRATILDALQNLRWPAWPAQRKCSVSWVPTPCTAWVSAISMCACWPVRA